MLIDEVTIKVKAGDGGRGAVAFNGNLKSLGPTGASGGEGGSVYLEGTDDLGALYQFRNKKEWKAINGANGKTQFSDGNDGDDLILRVPLGTVVHIDNQKNNHEITKIGERVMIAHGGKGGRGNFLFRSSINTSPREFEFGTPGETFTITLELKLIADVGLIGLPNVGKSSLLNALTNAKSKVANYQFTTLEPHLGAYYGGIILADIPGLIEGASGGRGLGIKFLRHIERTRVLFHCIAADSENPAQDYETVRRELGQYNPILLQKPEYILLTRWDIAGEKGRPFRKDAIPVSIYDDTSLNALKNILNSLKK